MAHPSQTPAPENPQLVAGPEPVGAASLPTQRVDDWPPEGWPTADWPPPEWLPEELYNAALWESS
jgi:hypothetical protein